MSGLLEVVLKNHVADKTDWRKMLKGDAPPVDLLGRRDELLAACASEIQGLIDDHGEDSFTPITNAEMTAIRYPVNQYPVKVTSLSFDKTPLVKGELQGIKGQYLIFENGVINMRKFAGYGVTLDSV